MFYWDKKKVRRILRSKRFIGKASIALEEQNAWEKFYPKKQQVIMQIKENQTQVGLLKKPIFSKIQFNYKPIS